MASHRIGMFCKSFKPDLSWLYFALNSFRQNWKEPDTPIVVVAEPDCKAEIEHWPLETLAGVRVVYVQPWPCGYCHAMATKLCADLYLPDCRLILLFDSDMVLTRPTRLTDLMYGDAPTIVYDTWHSDIDQQTRETSRRVWSPAVQHSMGVELDRDWMVSPTWLYWSGTFRGAREMIQSHCRMPFWQAVYCNHPYDWQKFTEHPMKLCDMQALGVYAYRHEGFRYRIVQRERGLDYGPMSQGWSHSIDSPKITA